MTSTFIELRTAASLNSIPVLTELLDVALRALQADEATRHDLAVAVAELTANVCSHEYGDTPGEISLHLATTLQGLKLSVISQGPPFDLKAALKGAEDPNPLGG